MPIDSFSQVASNLKSSNPFLQGQEILGDKRKNATNVHRTETHKTGPFGKDPDQRKVRSGAAYIAKSIDKELNTEGAGKRILSKLGLGSKVTIGDLKDIKKEVQRQKAAIELGATSHSEKFENLVKNLGGDQNLSSKRGNHSVCYSVMKDGSKNLYEHGRDTSSRDHKTYKFGGVSYNLMSSGTKKHMGLEYIARSLDNSMDKSRLSEKELADGGIKSGRQILNDLGISGRVKMRDLPRIKRALEEQQGKLDTLQKTAFAKTVENQKKEGEAAVKVQKMGLSQTQTETRVSQKEFADGKIHVNENSKLKISAEGAGGVIFVNNEGTKEPSVVLKIELPYNLAVADHVTKISNSIENEGVSSPMRLPNHEVIKLDKQSEEFKALASHLEGLINDNNSDPRTKEKATLYLEHLNKTGLVSKYETMTGKQIPDYSTEEKAELVKSDFFPKELGKASTMSAILGLIDHAGLNGMGNSNLTNLFLDKNGKISFIDLDTKATELPEGETRGTNSIFSGHDGTDYKYGYSDGQVEKSIGDVMTFLEKAVNGNPKDVLAWESSGFGSTDHPLREFIVLVLKPGPEGSLFDHHTEKERANELISEEDKLKFTARTILGVIEGLEFLAANAEKIGQAYAEMPNSNIENPKELFSELKKQIGEKIDTLKSQFQSNYAQYL